MYSTGSCGRCLSSNTPRSSVVIVRARVKLGVMLKRGPSYWKMNSFCLQNALYKDGIVRLWESWQSEKHRFDDISAWWDVGKARLHDLRGRFGRDLSASRTLVRREHQRAIVECQRHMDCSSLSAFYSLAEHRRALSDLDRHELEGARVRSRLLWTKQCETSHKLFTNFERQRAHDGFVYRLGDESGTSHSSIPSYSRHKHSASCGRKRSDPLTAPILHYIV